MPQKMGLQRYGEQMMSNQSIGGNTNNIQEQMAKSRLTIIAENSPDMNTNKMRNSKY